MVFQNVFHKCQWIVCTENKHISERSAKQEVCDLSKVSKFRQLIFWLLAEMLRCSANAEQAPVDNHLLCGGKQGEMSRWHKFYFAADAFSE